jgi:hypothetical protein
MLEANGNKVARSRGRLLRSAAPLLAGLGVLVAAPVAYAEQFVLLDVTFTFTKADADNATPSKSHYYVKGDRLNAATPIDWTKPIDYRNGRIHVHTEVLDKPPGAADTRWTLCYIARKGIDDGYGCSNTALYTEEGVWEFEQGMTEWWQNDNIDWTQGVKQVDIVMKDGKGVFAHTQPDPERWFPTTVRIAMIQVSEGSTYDPSLIPGLGGGGADGGAGAGSGGNAGSAAGGLGGTAGATSAGSGSGGIAETAGSGGSGPSVPTAGAPSGSGGGSSSGGMPASAAATTSNSAAGANDDAGCSFGASKGRGVGLGALAIALLALWRRRR